MSYIAVNTKCTFKIFLITYSYDWSQWLQFDRLVFDPPKKHLFSHPCTGFGADILFSSECLPLQAEGQNLKPISFEWHRLEYAEL